MFYMERRVPDGHCDDMLPEASIDAMWSKEIEEIAFRGQHFACNGAVYFKIGSDIMVSRLDVNGLTSPEIVSDAKIQHKAFTVLSAAKTERDLESLNKIYKC